MKVKELTWLTVHIEMRRAAVFQGRGKVERTPPVSFPI